MSLFLASKKYGKSSSSSRAVIQQLRNGQVPARPGKSLREKQLSSSTQRTTSTEGTLYDQDHDNVNNILIDDDERSGFWLGPSLTDDEEDEIEFFCQNIVPSSGLFNKAGPVIRARWRRRSDSVDEPSSLESSSMTSTDVSTMDPQAANQQCTNSSSTRKDQVWMVNTYEGRDDDDGDNSHSDEEVWGEQIEVLRRSSLNHSSSKSSSARGNKARRSFFQRTKQVLLNNNK